MTSALFAACFAVLLGIVAAYDHEGYGTVSIAHILSFGLPPVPPHSLPHCATAPLPLPRSHPSSPPPTQAYSGPYHMDVTGQNMCEFRPSSLDNRWQVYYAAMNEADWDAAGGKGGICGKCIRVTGVKGQTTSGFNIKPIMVKVVDQCPSWACDQGSVDFSTTALQAITGFPWDKKLIQWEYADCNADPLVSNAQAAAAKKAAAERKLAAQRRAVAERKAAAARAAAAKAAAEKAAAERAAAAKAAAEKAAAERAAAARAAAAKAAAEKAAAERAAAAKAAAAKAAAEKAAAERAAFQNAIKETAPQITAEATEALSNLATVTQAADTVQNVNPVLNNIAIQTSVPVETARAVVQDVAQQAQQALDQATQPVVQQLQSAQQSPQVGINPVLGKRR